MKSTQGFLLASGLFLLLLSFTLPGAAQSFGFNGAMALTYSCEIIIAADDVPLKAGIWNFTTAEKTGSHGGDAQAFIEGNHQVEVIADAQWLGLRWFRKGKKIAEGVFVLGNMDRTLSRVAILYDPSDNGDQVSLGCQETGPEAGKLDLTL